MPTSRRPLFRRGSTSVPASYWPGSTGDVPADAILAEDGDPILTEDGDYILTES